MNLDINITKLFSVDDNESIQYEREISRIIHALQENEDYLKDKEMSDSTFMCTIPYVLRCIGIPSGTVSIRNSALPHMLGIGKTNNEQNLHDVGESEIRRLPDFFYNPHAIFRSNTDPNRSILVCKNIITRQNPFLIAARVSVKDMYSTNIVLSGYEKDNNPKEFFGRLYEYGYCLYTEGNDDFFSSIAKKKGNPGLSKENLIEKWKDNSGKTVYIAASSKIYSEIIKQNLEGIGYNIITGKSEKMNNIDYVVCDRKSYKVAEKIFRGYKGTKDIQICFASDLLPRSVFEKKMNKLKEISSKLPEI